jgi:hypothetical protein
MIRCALAVLLAASLAAAGEQADGKAPKLPNDNPPVGKAPLVLAEDFEGTAAGEVPAGYAKQGAVGVAEDVAHSGRRSLRIEPATNGPRRITFKGEALTALGGRHWGRLYYRVQLPAPVCEKGVIHSTIVSAVGQSPLHQDPIEVRPLDTILGTQGTHSYIWNVQPRKRPEFASGSASKFKYTDRWTLAEWFLDHATQTYRLFIDGEEVRDASFTKGAGNFEKSEIPAVLESIAFGWWNYQAAGAGFTAWIDDLALSRERIGLRGLTPPAKPKKP